MREESAARLERYLADKKRISVVEDPGRANVVVEVLSGATAFSPLAPGAVFDPNAVPVNITAAGRTTRLTESSRDRYRALHKLANRIDEWVRKNRQAIVGKPGTAR